MPLSTCLHFVSSFYCPFFPLLPSALYSFSLIITNLHFLTAHPFLFPLIFSLHLRSHMSSLLFSLRPLYKSFTPSTFTPLFFFPSLPLQPVPLYSLFHILLYLFTFLPILSFATRSLFHIALSPRFFLSCHSSLAPVHTTQRPYYLSLLPFCFLPYPHSLPLFNSSPFLVFLSSVCLH